MSLRVLMVVYYYPPLGGIASLRALSFARHLPEFGWEPTVIAPSNGAYHLDPSLVTGAEVVRSRAFELSRAGKRVLRAGGDDAQPANPGAIGATVRDHARRYLYFPDSQVGWFPHATFAGLQTLRGQQFEAIFSSSNPMTAHLVARHLARCTRLAWVAELRDPWSALLPPEHPHRARAERFERSLANQAAAIAMTSPTWAAEHARRWGRPVSTLANGAPDDVPRSEAPTELVVTHLGSYYPDSQSLSAVWRTLGRLRGEPDAPPIRIRLIGDPPAVLTDELRAAGLEQLVTVTGFVSAGAAARLLASSSVLLAAGPRDRRPALRGWIPAKLFDYLATDVPILWIGERPNDGADLLAGEPGCYLAATDDDEAAAAALLTAHGRRYARAAASISRRARAGELARLLDSVVSS